MTQLQTILVLSSTVDKKINVTLENLKENIYKLILPADTKGEEWKLPGRLGSEVVFGNLQSFNFTSLTYLELYWGTLGDFFFGGRIH